MKKTAILALLLLFPLLSAGVQEHAPTVYICTSPNAYAYHTDRNCRYLLNCSKGTIQAITREQARQMNRKPCKKCAS